MLSHPDINFRMVGDELYIDVLGNDKQPIFTFGPFANVNIMDILTSEDLMKLLESDR